MDTSFLFAYASGKQHVGVSSGSCLEGEFT